MNGCFCTRDIGAITEGVIEKLTRGYIYGAYRYIVFNWIFIFIFIFENGTESYSIKKCLKFMRIGVRVGEIALLI